MSKHNIGPKRLVVGAHYGLKEWMIQRITAIVMVVFTIVLLIAYIVNGNPSYDGWAGLFANQLMKVLTS
jgi:succinate dehydrogenase / fumarate reductase membrane anchor subunit